MKEVIICDERRSGIELVHLRGEPGYQDEELVLSNSLGNGLRFEVANFDDDPNWFCFHIHSPVTALLLANRLIEWSGRIANPADPG